VRLLDAWGDADIAALLGLDREQDFAGAEPEAPDLLCLVGTGRKGAAEPAIDATVDAAREGHWLGRANRLSRRHEFDWPVIEETRAAARKPRTPPAEPTSLPLAGGSLGEGGNRQDRTLPLPPSSCELPAVELIRQRRSAQAFDGVTRITATALFRILDATLPRAGVPPFDAWNWPPRVHLLLFVHRVQGLPPGVYCLCRDGGAEPALRAAMKAEFAWDLAPGCPGHLRLFHLLRADARQAAKTLSCQQGIAGDGAFSLGMLAEFDRGLAEGPWVYRRLFWECGLVGQALYLEAEAAGVRGTGIGCFFDDPVHDLLGLRGSAFQSLYHFTVGGPVVDDRLQSLPGYGHREAL
jgi:nitroreductase